MLNEGKYGHHDGTMTVDTGGTGVVDTNGDIAVADVRDLKTFVANVNCLHAGTGHAILEGTWDGVNWKTLIAEFDVSGITFVAGLVAEQYSNSDSNGMPIPLLQVRLRATQAFGGSASLSLTVAGLTYLPYR